MRKAIVRAVSPSIGQCELTHLARQPIDVALACAQHEAYVAQLAALGCEVIRLAPEPTLPDGVFVEDTAVVVAEAAIITRPGAVSRRAETDSVEWALAAYRPLHRIQDPGTVDGGDVLRLGRQLYVGLSSRSNGAAIAQLNAALLPWGYAVHSVPVAGCLHLKSAVTQVAEETLLVNPAWVDAQLFGGFRIIEIDPSEPYAANALLVGEGVVYPTSYPATLRRLARAGINVQPLDVSELIKAEGAATCCSIVFD